MAANPAYGWIRIDSDAMRLAFEDSDLDIDFLDVDDNLTPLPGDSIIGFDFGTMKRTLKLFNVRAKTLADISRIIDKLKDLSIAGVPYEIKWQINSGGSFFEWDGDSSTMNVLCRKMQGITKEGAGDQTLYKVRQIIFKEADK